MDTPLSLLLHDPSHCKYVEQWLSFFFFFFFGLIKRFRQLPFLY